MLTFFTLADFANSIFFHTFALTLKMACRHACETTADRQLV